MAWQITFSGEIPAEEIQHDKNNKIMQHLLYYQRTSDIDDKMIYKNAAVTQMIFIRDTICHSIGWVTPFVLSFHRSKSIELPVYGFTMKNGIKIICRDNFYDWKVSVELPRPIGKSNAIPEDLICSCGESIHPCYCEGFKKEWVYGPYVPDDPDLTRFTVEIADDYRLYTFLYFLNHLFEPISFEGTTMTREEIINAINKIYEQHGATEIRENYRWSDSDPRMEPVMGGWELLYRTYDAIERTVEYIQDETHHVRPSIDFGFDTAQDPEKFADFILSNRDAYEIFKWENSQYTHKF